MIHDALPDPLPIHPRREDRRARRRQPASRDAMISWHHQPEQTVRYPLVNEGSGGCLIRSSVPLISGMTGIIRGYLPDHAPVGRPTTAVLVAWSQRRGETWHVGLRFLGIQYRR